MTLTWPIYTNNNTIQPPVILSPNHLKEYCINNHLFLWPQSTLDKLESCDRPSLLHYTLATRMKKKKRNTLYSVEIKNYCYNLNRTGKQSLQTQGVVCLLCISISWLLDTIVLHSKKICHLFRLLCSSVSLLLNTIVFHFKRTAILFYDMVSNKHHVFFFLFWNYQKPKVTFSTSYSSKCSCKEQKW